jgi:hypothetical protein
VGLDKHNFEMKKCMKNSLCLNFVHLLALKPNLELAISNKDEHFAKKNQKKPHTHPKLIEFV